LSKRYVAEVGPGVTSFSAAAAAAAEPLVRRTDVLTVLPGTLPEPELARRLSDRLKPWDVIEKRLVAVAEADLVLGIYNPASRSRTTQVADAKAVLLRHRPADTVVVIGRDVGRPGESLEVTTLEKLDPDTIDMKCLLIVGAAGTSVTAAGAVWTKRSVG
ncbi:SAM-dependent methyltransferase, partial [Rhodococcus chondri]